MKKRLTLFVTFILLFLCRININGQGNEKMLEMEKVYRIAFSKFLMEKLQLEKYDQELKESNMRFIPRDEEHKDDAQKNDELGLDFFYIRNDVHIDRLTDEQKEILISQSINEVLPEEILQLVEQTYVDVMGYKVIESAEDRNVKTTYDVALDPYFVTYDTILIKLATMREYDNDGNYIDLQHEKEKEKELKKYVDDMQKELQGKLGDTPIAIQLEV